MRITADTNLLVRAMIGDDRAQTPKARRALQDAELVVLPNVVLCELVWVLARLYRLSRNEIAEGLETLCGASNVCVDQTALNSGLAVLRAGGDFADAVIALEGERMGGDTFVTFDHGAIRRLQALGKSAREPG